MDQLNGEVQVIPKRTSRICKCPLFRCQIYTNIVKTKMVQTYRKASLALPNRPGPHATSRNLLLPRPHGANLEQGWLTWPDGSRQRSFTNKTLSRRLTRPARELTWHNLARHCSDSVKNRPRGGGARRRAATLWTVFHTFTAVTCMVGPG